METETTTTPRAISAIAYDIYKDWKRPYFGALPYLQAMIDLQSITDKYLMDDARSIVRYFLSNATSYRGENARKYKAELKALLGD